MKSSKHSSVANHVISTHLSVGKDRALANALLRMSERAATIERTKADDVIYCGEGEPFYGWTNAVPNPRYTESTRPKQVKAKKKKLGKKSKSETQNLENSEYTLDATGVTSNVDGQYHSYATLRDMYDNYKKNMRIRSMTKKNEIIDPVTFKYIPWNERIEDESIEENEFKLPMLKMVHATQPSKLMEVLEKYMKRHKVPYLRHNDDSDDASSLNTCDVFEYYDKYKWNFKKEKQVERARNITKRRIEHVHLPSLTSQRENKDNFQPNAKEKLVRYVNGAVRKKRRNNAMNRDGKNAFYIKVHGGSTQERGGVVKLERRREVGAPGTQPVDHWVARVIIKNSDDSGSDTKQYNDSESNSSVIIVPDTRWRRKNGVVAGERERIQREIDKSHFQQQQEMKLNQLRKRLLRSSYDVEEKPSYRVRHRAPPPLPHIFSVVEAAKVSMKYNVETSKRKGIVREVLQEDSINPYLGRSGIPIIKPLERKVTHNRYLTIGGDHVTQIFPSGEKQTDKTSKEQNSKTGRLFLNRGAALKDDKRKSSHPSSNPKLPILPKQVKMTSSSLDKSRISDDDAKEEASYPETEVNSDATTGNDAISALPVVNGASATFHAALSNDVVNRPHSPSSSTFNSDRMLKQVIDTANFLKKTPSKDAEFLRYKVIQQPGAKATSGNERKPLHPPHNKNRGREKIQDLIDEERGVVSSVINHLNTSWVFGNKTYVQEQLGHPDSFKAALTTAIAKARLVEESKHHQIPAKLSNSGGGGSVIMRRRVVPPILPTAPTTAKQPDRNQQEFPLVSTAVLNNNNDDATANDATIVTSQTKENKSTKRHKLRTSKRHNERSSRKYDDVDNTIDDVILSGDVIIKQRPTPKLLEHSFAASITSVKPTRRIVNVVPTRLVQKG